MYLISYFTIQRHLRCSPALFIGANNIQPPPPRHTDRSSESRREEQELLQKPSPMPPAQPPALSWISSVPISFLSAAAAGALVLLFFADYFRRRRAEVASIPAPPELAKPSSAPKPRKPHAARKAQHKHGPDKDHGKQHHHLDVNTLKGHGDSVTGLSFSPDGRNLATACADGVVRVFKLDDASSKSFKFLRINLPAGANPTAITFSEGASSIVVAGQNFIGATLYMYGNVEKPYDDGKQKGKSFLPEIMWEHEKVHDMRSILTLVGVAATYGSADGSTIISSCSEGTDIKLWHGKSGKNLGTVDTNQLKNTMSTVSPNGRFLAAAAFTADVKVWEIVYSKDGSVKEVVKAMQLKGHKSAVNWLCFTPDSSRIITSSKDGTIRIWNINVRYHLEEDPKTLKVVSIPLLDANGSALHYDKISLSPDGKFLAATHGSTLQWLCAETGQVLDIADKSHEGDITGIAWSPKKIPMGSAAVMVLATAGADKKVKLWMAPGQHPS